MTVTLDLADALVADLCATAATPTEPFALTLDRALRAGVVVVAAVGAGGRVLVRRRGGRLVELVLPR